MKFIELFAGIGGFRLGLQRCGIKDERTADERIRNTQRQFSEQLNGSANRFHCVWSNEIDKYASQIYRKNFGDEELCEGDIREIKADDIPDHDLLTAGFPCQSFSIAGKRQGFADIRGTLYFEIVRVLKEKRPRFLLLENVKGLLSHEKGQTFATILNSLDELGYDLQWEVLNSKNFGVPQNRERVFIVGHLRGECRPEIFPIGGTDKQDGRCVDIIAHRNIYRRNRQTFNPEGITESLDTAGGGGREFHTLDKMRIRRLTPTECERLQGFPDGWTEKGIKNDGNEVKISDTQRYRCLGNAVTTNVIKEIGCRL